MIRFPGCDFSALVYAAGSLSRRLVQDGTFMHKAVVDIAADAKCSLQDRDLHLRRIDSVAVC